MAGRDAADWSLTLGHLRGVPVRLHFFFLIFIVLALTVTWPDMLNVALLIGVLTLSLLLHEMAHAFAAVRMGGRVDQIVIGPFGGLVAPRVPDEPEVQVFVAAAGPLVHLTLAVIAAAALSLGGDDNVVHLLSPITPAGLTVGGSWMVAGKLLFWFNWMLLLINLLPAYPFDGGPALRATLWPLLGRRTACVVTSRVAMAIAIGLCITAIFVRHPEPNALLPLQVPLVTLAIFLFFSAQQDLSAARQGGLVDDLSGYHVPADGIDLLEELWSEEVDSDAVLVEQRRDQRRERREQARRAQEEYEDARLDDILARLHKSSLDQLSGEERALLERASERYRRRKQSSDTD